MTPARQFESLHSISFDDERPVHLAVGMFDGLHCGHRKVVEAAMAASDADGGHVGALTFWPHPSRLFNPEDPARMILNPEIKRRELSQLGLEFIVEEPFTQQFAAIEAVDFLDYLLDHMPKLASLHAGENWRFGRGRVGDMAMLTALGKEKGVRVDPVECLAVGGVRVSSTRIRSLLLQGRVEEANALLGYDYYSIGTVIRGKQIGRSLDAATLNLPFEGDLKPAYGVYLVTVSDVSLEKTYNGVANFGVRPTVESTTDPVLEVHMLEECPFEYGHRLKVDWKRHLRPEKKFDSVEKLREQIALDVYSAKQFFEDGEIA